MWYIIDRDRYLRHPKYDEFVKKYVYLKIGKNENDISYGDAMMELFINYYGIELLDDETPEERECRILEDFTHSNILFENAVEMIVFPYVVDEIELYNELSYDY